MKRLNLRKETLAELSSDELASMGGGYILTPVINTMPVKGCVETQVATVCQPNYLTITNCQQSYQPSCLCTPPQ